MFLSVSSSRAFFEHENLKQTNAVAFKWVQCELFLISSAWSRAHVTTISNQYSHFASTCKSTQTHERRKRARTNSAKNKKKITTRGGKSLTISHSGRRHCDLSALEQQTCACACSRWWRGLGGTWRENCGDTRRPLPGVDDGWAITLTTNGRGFLRRKNVVECEAWILPDLKSVYLGNGLREIPATPHPKVVFEG